MTGDDASSGGDFYDRPGVFGRYADHRHGGVYSPNTVMEEPALRGELGDVAGMRVLDLGCGDAAIGRDLLASGCRSYLGVDASERMVEAARRTLSGTGGRVERVGIEQFSSGPGTVDLVLSRLALHYLPDVSGVLAASRRWLSPGGRLVVSVVHPVITAQDARGGGGERRTSWLVDDYFVPGERRREWLGDAVRWHHRTVEDYVQALLVAGFVLTSLRECAPQAELFTGHDDELARRRRVPLFLLLAGRST